jgi:MinD superfamily P-loop ATPase
LSDLTIAVEVAREIDVPCGVVINHDGLGDESVERYCAQEAIPVLMRIPFDRRIAEAYCRGETLAAAMPSWQQAFRELFDRIRDLAAVENVR